MVDASITTAMAQGTNSDTRHTRRRVILTAGASIVGSTAGCIGGDSSGGDYESSPESDGSDNSDSSDGSDGSARGPSSVIAGENVGGPGQTGAYPGSWAEATPSEAVRDRANPAFNAGMMGPTIDGDRRQAYVAH